jgi:hypothetical protein
MLPNAVLEGEEAEGWGGFPFGAMVRVGLQGGIAALWGAAGRGRATAWPVWVGSEEVGGL